MNFVVITKTVLDIKKYETVMQMTEMAIASFNENLKGDWEWLILQSDFSKDYVGGVDHYNGDGYVADNLHFKDAYDRIKRLWLDGGHNILFISADVLCVRPCEVFGRFKEFSMWWRATNAPRNGFNDYLNSGITYFPKEMDKKVWDVGDYEWAKRTDNMWDKSQDIYNKMFWSQKPDLKKHLNNDLHWSPYYADNVVGKSDAKIIHYHGSKGVGGAYQAMRQECHERGIDWHWYLERPVR